MNQCVMCGATIPEGTQICYACKSKNSYMKISYKK